MYQSLSGVQILLSRSFQTWAQLLSLLQKGVHADFLLQDGAVAAIKAKIKLEQVGDAISGIAGLFGKK